MAQVVKYSPRKLEALSSIPNIGGEGEGRKKGDTKSISLSPSFSLSLSLSLALPPHTSPISPYLSVSPM
jgi:hypothetical protein